MGLFNRKARDGPNNPNATTTNNNWNNNNNNNNSKSNRRGTHTYSMARKPTFGEWLKLTWLDILTMIIMGAIGLGVYEAPPAPTRSFAVSFTDGEIVYPQFAFPLRKEVVPIWLAALLASLIPILIILVMQIRIRSFWDVNNAIIGLLYSLITAAVFQVFLKWLIGGLRPHFLTVCQPDLTLAKGQYDLSGYGSIYFTSDVCTGNKADINDSLESFPSGHSTAAGAGFVYLYLYLNAKLKVFSNYHPAMWKLIITYAPILGAILIGGALTIDEFHNWYDIAAGLTIGTVMAISAYRMVYASIWDWRTNHIPLNRSTPFAGDGGAELSNAVFTRRAGWGTHGAGAGAGVGGYNNHNHNDGTVYDNGANYENNGAGYGGGNNNMTEGGLLGHHNNNNNMTGQSQMSRKAVGTGATRRSQDVV